MKYIIYLLPVFCFIYACNSPDNEKEKAITLFEKGKNFEEQNLPDSAIKVYYQAIESLNSAKDDKLLAEIYNQWGDLLIKQGLAEKALQVYDKALKHTSKLKNNALISKSLRNIGKAYFLQDSSKASIKYFEQALELSSQINDKEEIGTLYNNLSVVYRVLNQFEKAIEYNSMAIKASKDSIDLYKNYSNRGIILIGLKQYDSAWHYAVLGSQSSDIFTKATCYRMLSQLAYTLGKRDSVRYLKLYQTVNDTINHGRHAVIKVGDALHQYELKQSIKEHDQKTLRRYILIAICGILILFLFLYGIKLKIREINGLKREIDAKQNQVLNITKKYQVKMQETNPEIPRTVQSTNEFNDLQKQIADLINEIGILCAKRFVMSKVYSKTKKRLTESNKIEEADLKEFRNLVFVTFKDYINCLSVYYPKLTQSDHYFCCLFKIKFNIAECSILENRNKDVLYTQKSRIKDRLDVGTNTDYVFGLMFKMTGN